MEKLSYLYIFLQSNFLEVPIYLLFIHTLKKSGSTLINSSISITHINLLTHPIVFFVIMPLPISYLAKILIAETFAIAAESWLFTRFLPLKWAFAASLTANLFSWQLAPILTFYLFY